MSLLIKALHKAEQEKASEGKSTTSGTSEPFELAPKELDLSAEAGLYNAEPVRAERTVSPAVNQNQKAAGVIFAAKSARGESSTKTLVLTGVILLILIAGAFYYYLESLKQPEVVMPAPLSPVVTIPDSTAASPVMAEVTPVEPEGLSADETAVSPMLAEMNDSQDEREMPPVNAGFSLAAKPSTPAAPVVYGEPVAKPEDTSVKVTRNDPPPAINPNLTVAYDAFNAGDDATAQAYYRKVLQADIRNTDALLGMAAVALRQGRGNDALGWYGKVLEVEPRNSFAQAAMASVLSEVDPVSSESRIKNLIAIQPGAAHLHAALGGIYADQGQWTQAQQAYFEAHRLDAANAEHAFNLAVSLDQLGKSALAIQYYRQTLSLLDADNSTIDRAALEARIAQLQ